MTCIRFLPLALASALLIAAGSAAAQEVQFLSARHDVSFEQADPETPSLKPWTVRALGQADLIALVDQGMLQLVLVGSPDDARLEARAHRLEAELRRIGVLQGEEPPPRLTNPSVPDGVMKLGARQRTGDAVCPGWTLHVEMDDLFGLGAPLRLSAFQRLIFVDTTRIRAVPEAAQTSLIGPFSAPADLVLSDRAGALWEGAGRGTSNTVGGPGMRPEAPGRPPTEIGGATGCHISIGVPPPAQ